MSVLSDREIRKLCDQHCMIEHYVDDQVKSMDGEPVISFGISSYGYDARLAREYQIFSNVDNVISDPKDFDPATLVRREGDYCIVPPNSYILGRTIEYFRIPRNIVAICLGKSTYARCGIIINVTPLEPQWEGYVTMEISNSSPLPAKVYGGEGICQFVFFKADKECEISYADRKGKYQAQQGITTAKV